AVRQRAGKRDEGRHDPGSGDQPRPGRRPPDARERTGELTPPPPVGDRHRPTPRRAPPPSRRRRAAVVVPEQTGVPGYALPGEGSPGGRVRRCQAGGEGTSLSAAALARRG